MTNVLPYRSIRFRLTCWYVGVSALILTVFSCGVYISLRQSLFERVDSVLRSALEVSALSLRHEIEEHEGKQPGEESYRLVLRTMHQTSFPHQGVAVYDAGRLVANKPGDENFVPSLPTGSGGTPHRPVLLIQAAEKGSRRLAIAEVDVPMAKTTYRVVVGESLQETEAALNAIRRALLVAVPAALALLALGGYFLARKSLAPVMELSSTAEQISAQNLERRVEISNPQDELGRLGATFNRLLGRLENSFDQQRRFMADAAHELRTPLSVALTAAQVTIDSPRSEEEYRDALTVIEQQLRRLTRLVQNMFLLARADAGAYQLDVQPFYLDEVVQEAVRAAQVLARRRGVVVSVDKVPESLCQADEGLVRQAILILLDNAVKYTPSGGTVHVTLSHQLDRLIVRVADTGIGIPAEAQQRLFERFYRVDKARSRADQEGGAGLGLAIARWIAGIHKGTLTLVESGSHGSVFELALPAGQGPVDLELNGNWDEGRKTTEDGRDFVRS